MKNRPQGSVSGNHRNAFPLEGFLWEDWSVTAISDVILDLEQVRKGEKVLENIGALDPAEAVETRRRQHQAICAMGYLRIMLSVKDSPTIQRHRELRGRAVRGDEEAAKQAMRIQYELGLEEEGEYLSADGVPDELPLE